MSQTHVWAAWAAHATDLLKQAPETALLVLSATLHDADPACVKPQEWGQVFFALISSRSYLHGASIKLLDSALEEWVAKADPWQKFADQDMGWTALGLAIEKIDAAAVRALLNAPGAPGAAALCAVKAHPSPWMWQPASNDPALAAASWAPVPYQHPVLREGGDPGHPGLAVLSAWGAAVATSFCRAPPAKTIALVDAFLEKGVDVNGPATATGLPALALAAHPALVERLIRAGGHWELGPSPAETAEAWAASPMFSITGRVALLEAWTEHPPRHPNPSVGEGLLVGFSSALNVASRMHESDLEKAWVSAIKAAGKLAKSWGQPALAPFANGKTWPGLLAKGLVQYGFGHSDPQLPAALQPSQWVPRLGTGWAPTPEDAAWVIVLEAATNQQRMGRRHLTRLIGNEWTQHGEAIARLLLGPNLGPTVKARIAKALVDIAQFDDHSALGWASMVGQALALEYAQNDGQPWFESPWHSKRIRTTFPQMCERLLAELLYAHETGDPADPMRVAALALAAHRPKEAIRAAAQLQLQSRHVEALKQWKGAQDVKMIITAWSAEAFDGSFPPVPSSRRTRM